MCLFIAITGTKMAETTTLMEGLEEKVALEGSKLGWPDLVVIILYFVFVLAVGLFVSITFAVNSRSNYYRNRMKRRMKRMSTPKLNCNV